MERRQTIRSRGRPKKTIREVIEKDLELNDLDRSMVLDRTLWRRLIHVADPTQWDKALLYLKLCLLALCARENAVYAEERESEKQCAREFKGKPKA